MAASSTAEEVEVAHADVAQTFYGKPFVQLDLDQAVFAESAESEGCDSACASAASEISLLDTYSLGAM
eukprot:6862150-Karenia_brevis.AAC.1